jgi:DNA-binding transcriptional regulator YdaS (Cro superfamily)
MNLHDYISGGVLQSKLAAEIGVPRVLIHQWATGKRRVPAERCPAIERVTAGAVRCEDLRPDVDWAYLRNATSTNEAA